MRLELSSHPGRCFRRMLRPPAVSRSLVVLPTYNERENLEAILAAVLLQADDLEVLVVDDNSPDGTGQIADGLAEQQPRVHVMHRAGKQGLGTAYIQGFE